MAPLPGPTHDSSLGKLHHNLHMMINFVASIFHCFVSLRNLFKSVIGSLLRLILNSVIFCFYNCDFVLVSIVDDVNK